MWHLQKENPYLFTSATKYEVKLKIKSVLDDFTWLRLLAQKFAIRKMCLRSNAQNNYLYVVRHYSMFVLITWCNRLTICSMFSFLCSTPSCRTHTLILRRRHSGSSTAAHPSNPGSMNITRSITWIASSPWQTISGVRIKYGFLETYFSKFEYFLHTIYLRSILLDFQAVSTLIIELFEQKM